MIFHKLVFAGLRYVVRFLGVMFGDVMLGGVMFGDVVFPVCIGGICRFLQGGVVVLRAVPGDPDLCPLCSVVV